MSASTNSSVSGVLNLTAAQVAAVAAQVSGPSIAGTLVCDWNTNGALAMVSANSGESIALDSSVQCDGLPMVKCIQAASGTFIAEFVFTTPVTLAQMQTFEVPIRLNSNNTAWTGTANSLQLWLFDDATGTRQWRLNASLRGLDGSELRPGATHLVSFGPGSNSQGWAFGGTSAPTNTTDLDAYTINRVRIVFVNVSAGEAAWIGAIRANGRRRPVVSVVLDGQFTSQDSYILPMLEAQNLTCSMALQHTAIGIGGRMTEAQLARAYGYGHELIHHTYDHTKSNGYQDAGQWADAAAIAADINAGNAYMAARGWSRGIGYAVHGGATHPYNASVSAARQAIVTAGYQAAGVKSIRRGAYVMGALERLQSAARPGAVDPYSISGAIQITSTDNAASVTAIIDRAIARGEWAIVTVHRSVVSTPGSLEMTNANFLTWTQYLGTAVRRGEVAALPFGEAARFYGVSA